MDESFDQATLSIDISNDDELACAVTLAGLPGLSPKRLRTLIVSAPPSVVWQRVTSAQIPPGDMPRGTSAPRWQSWAQGMDPAEYLRAHRRRGVQVLVYGHAGYPERLLDDPDPPALLFSLGPAPIDDRVAVAIVGTRKNTRYGYQVARELGAELASRGIDVVSGLAYGIDAAAHAGAQTADPLRCTAVVASGLDVIYPPRNRELWNMVSEQGRLVSEWPLGCNALPWRFPARNRLVAALSVAVVVVESAAKGGSMYTVDEAVRRDRSVFAVPGSVHSPVSLGTNRLIADGAQILCQPKELADALAPRPRQSTLDFDDRGHGAGGAGQGGESGGGESGGGESGGGESGGPADSGSWLLDLIGWEPVSVDTVAAESRRSAIDVTLEVERQIAHGTIARLGGQLERLR